MSEHFRHHDYEKLVEEARLQRSIALGEAIANFAHRVWRFGERLVATVNRGLSPDRRTEQRQI